jgi:hypothetical protein
LSLLLGLHRHDLLGPCTGQSVVILGNLGLLLLLLRLTGALADLLGCTASWGTHVRVLGVSLREDWLCLSSPCDDDLRLILAYHSPLPWLSSLESDQVRTVERLHHQLLKVGLTRLE